EALGAGRGPGLGERDGEGGRDQQEAERTELPPARRPATAGSVGGGWDRRGTAAATHLDQLVEPAGAEVVDLGRGGRRRGERGGRAGGPLGRPGRAGRAGRGGGCRGGRWGPRRPAPARRRRPARAGGTAATAETRRRAAGDGRRRRGSRRSRRASSTPPPA